MTRSPYFRPLILAATICIGLMLASLYARPLFPVDETRYLTVAWEMHLSGNWILPSLNGEAYHHKPPVLFWLINLLWAIFGVSQSAAMIIPYLGAFAFLAASMRLATRLFPQQKDAPLVATALIGGCLPFVIYANLIMFDLLLGVFAVLGITAVYDYLTTRKPVHLLILGITIGLGVLTKGPVILLHIGTVLLLAKFWLQHPEQPLKKAILPILAAILLGAAIALSWAIPAAIEGGKEFSDKIFWGQTAGRMVKAFDHQRPFYWYLIFVPLFALPWLVSPSLWSGLKQIWQSNTPEDRRTARFLASWGLPVFVAFCFISGKQVHYLLPVLPCLGLWFTAAFLKVGEKTGKKDVWPVLIVTVLLSALPVLMKLLADHIGNAVEGSIHIEDTFARANIWPSLAAIAAILLLALTVKGDKIKGLAAIALSMMLMMAGFQTAAKNGFFVNYDLTPLALQIQKIDMETSPKKLPLAFVRNYHGEFGFLARLDRPVQQILPEELDAWLKEHPSGLAIIRTKRPQEYAPYHVIFEMPYQLSGTYALISLK